MVSSEDLAAIDRNTAGMLATAMRAVEEGWVCEDDALVLCGSPFGIATTNVAILTGATTAARVVEATAREFGRRRWPYSVWTRAHADEAVAADLAREGWTRALSAPQMICDDRDLVHPVVPRELQLSLVQTERDRAAYREMMEAAWGIYGIDARAIGPYFARLGALCAPGVQAVLGRVGSEAVAGAIVYVLHGIAGIGWVGTLPSASRRGYGAAVTWRAVLEGFSLGGRFASLQASPLGAPVYQRLGFRTVSHYQVHVPPPA